MRAAYSLTLLLLVAAFAGQQAENIDSDTIERFCYAEEHKNTRKSCECNSDDAPPWGMRALSIDCSYKELQTSDFSEVLPLYVTTLDLSWNKLEAVPKFSSDSLRLLNLMHNNISKVASKNFVRISNLRELYLSWNSIQTVEAGAFDDLAHLQALDLSHNNLHTLSALIFKPMLVLDSLSLSWNRQLNNTAGLQELDLYKTFGINAKLRTLRLQACSLTSLVLPAGASLVELDLRRNLLNKIPAQLPTMLEKLDLSENLFESLGPNDTSLVPHISELYFEDMPRLESVAENAFVPLQLLQKASFQNSRRLNNFDGYAFGANTTKMPMLKSLIFRGTLMRTLNATLAPIFQQLTQLDLNGMPLHCDCQLVWLKEVHVETNGRCFNPSRMRGTRVTDARVNDFSCDRWPRWVYGFLILVLIIVCSGAIYFIVMCLRPHHGGVTMRHRVGVGSPYARVTIEPNRQENNHF